MHINRSKRINGSDVVDYNKQHHNYDTYDIESAKKDLQSALELNPQYEYSQYLTMVVNDIRNSD